MRYLLAFAAIVAMLLITSQVGALSIDGSALNSDENKQVQANVVHLQKFPSSQVEIGGKYSKTSGKDHIYEVYLANQYLFPVGLTLESDMRYLQSHTTFSSAAGYGYAFLSASGGARVEFPDGGSRDTFGKVALRAAKKLRSFRLTGSVEALAKGVTKDDFERLDYRLAAKYQWRKIYVALRAEEVRKVQLQGVSLGVSL